MRSLASFFTSFFIMAGDAEKPAVIGRQRPASLANLPPLPLLDAMINFEIPTLDRYTALLAARLVWTAGANENCELGLRGEFKTLAAAHWLILRAGLILDVRLALKAAWSHHRCAALPLALQSDAELVAEDHRAWKG